MICTTLNQNFHCLYASKHLQVCKERYTRMLLVVATVSILAKTWQTTQMPTDREWLNTAMVLMESGTTWDIFIVTVHGSARETMDI